MDGFFIRGKVVTYYKTFLTLENKEPTNVVNPIITIRHIDASYNVVTDINEAAMSLLSESSYFFKWQIPVDAYLGTYNIEVEGYVDGEYSENNETIIVKP